MLYAICYGTYIYKQVTIGESTCAAKFIAAPAGPTGGGKALLEASELSQIGLERGKTAREVIQIMGELAVKYGFYSSEWDSSTADAIDGSQGESGEALTVADPDEAWVFHILPDDTGASAIWVAQRVPDDHIAVVANQFIIRDVIKDSPDFM
jgi:dipeptidase